MDVARFTRHNFLKNHGKFQYLCTRKMCIATVKGATAGNDGFLKDFENCHLETSKFQKALLGIGSAVVSLADPKRGDMIAALGETTGLKSLEFVRSKMLESPEGSEILTAKPRITSETVNLTKLENLPEGTVGKTYFNFLKKYGYTPDARLAVRFVDDVELAYVIQRYREVHDLFHTILDMPTNMLGEVTVKWVEAIQTRLPMCVGGALFGAARLAPKYCRHYSTLRKARVELDVPISEGNEKMSLRRHPGYLQLRCVEVPNNIQDAIHAILRERNLPSITEAAKKLSSYLQSRKPPFEDEDLRLKQKEIFDEVRNQLAMENSNASEDERNYYKNVVSSRVNTLMRSRIYHWKPLVFDDQLSHVYLLSRCAAEYAVIKRVFNEIKVKDPDFQPKNVFDFGSGVGTVSWTAHDLWKKSLREYFTVDASPAMNDLARLILQENNTENEPFVKQLFQRQFLPATPRQYDLVVSAYSLMELNSLRSRADIVSNLWAKTSKYLVIVEQGTNAGFNLINEARDLVLHLKEQQKVQCHVFAPCPHDSMCPRRLENPATPCNFPVTFSPLRHLSSGSNSSQERFSFVILKKGDRETEKAWPRIVRETMKRHKHIVCSLCVNSGKLENTVITASKHGKQVYKCVKHSSWGDLIPAAIEFDEPSSDSTNDKQ